MRSPHRSLQSSTQKPARSPQSLTRKPARSPRMSQYGGSREYQVGDKVLIIGRPSLDYSVVYNGRRESTYGVGLDHPEFIGHVGTIRHIRPAGSQKHTGHPLYTLYEVYPDDGPYSDVFPAEHIAPHQPEMSADAI